jgi:hypothetical protein
MGGLGSEAKKKVGACVQDDGGIFESHSQTPQEVTRGHSGHSTLSQPESQQEQPVLSLRLQADPCSPSSPPAQASNRWNPASAKGPVSACSGPASISFHPPPSLVSFQS